MMGPCGVVAMLLLHAGQASPLNGTWELTRIFRAGPVLSTRAVPIDSTVYLRITLETHVGDWISGRLYRRYRGEPDRSKVEAGPLRGEGRFIIGVEIEKPAWARARTAAWLVGDTLRFGQRYPRLRRPRRGRFDPAGAGRADLRVAPPARGVPEHRLPQRARPDDARVRRAGGLGGRFEPEVPVARHTGGSPKLGAVTRIVAVSATRRTDAGRERVALNTAYVYALMRAGVVPLVVPPILDPDAACAALDGVHGLVLTGGEDVEPGRYGAAPHPKLGETDRARDAVELALIAGAERRRLPILAICRGIQILNVALGGTLYQDLTSERPGPVDHADTRSRHGLRIESGTLLDRKSTRLNSSHVSISYAVFCLKKKTQNS